MNISWKSISKVAIAIGLIIGTVSVTAQTKKKKKAPVAKKVTTVKAVPVTNQLLNDTCLYPFFDRLENGAAEVTGILHLGDSHLQAGFLTGTLAAKLQAQFGNAGRGYVFPYTEGRTNGPDDYRWGSNTSWSAARVVERTNMFTGPGGIVLYSQQPSPDLSFSFRNSTNTFTSAELYYEGGDIPGIDKKQVQGPGRSITRGELKFDNPVSSFNVRWSGLPDTRFYGAVLKNGQPGILYHTVGINGAMFSNYSNAGNTLELQAEWFNPQLVIISLGTNEAFGYMAAAQFRNEMDRAVQELRDKLPEGTAFLLTTPPSGMGKAIRTPYRKKVNGKYKTYYRSKFRTNTHVAVIRDEIIKYCKENGLACWDFYNIMKGDARFSRGWSSDHLHFNATGYNMEGALLYEAIDKSFKKYHNL
ncbi:GDSL-type esterase/lipase family protein [uncultured Chitinophaga sp.]|uniref:GDSL-type esterase/lipase family protein n=1 Tax=uncultured Chitinophaga sp. TaxID=339340 RepID=UPI0025F58741|nr:GDSL-type esterase/lipase family protein [uncultured Chitinophaga sp.]